MADLKSKIAALNDLIATSDFTNTVDTGRETVAVYVATTADGSVITIANADSDDVNFVLGGTLFPVATAEAVAGTDVASCTIVYFYARGTD